MAKVNVAESMPVFMARLLRALEIYWSALDRLPETGTPSPGQAADAIMARAAARIVADSFKRRLDYELGDDLPPPGTEGSAD